jgi:hypothetical protein
VPVERHRLFHLNARNQGLRRLQVMTRGLTLATAVLTGVFAALAAQGNAGRKHVPPVRAIRTTARPVHPVRIRTKKVPPPPSLPPLSSGDEGQAAPAPAPAPPTQAPQSSYSPPVVVSGGS